MGDVKGFMKYDRQDFKKEPVADRVKHWKEFTKFLPEKEIKEQEKSKFELINQIQKT